VRHRRTHGQRGVGHAAAHHHLRAVAQRIGNALRADVGVGADETRLGKVSPTMPRSSARPSSCDRSSPSTTATRGAGRPSSTASADTAGRRTRIGRAEVADDRNVVDQAQPRTGVSSWSSSGS
jgi:hypothetical protein